MWTGVVNLILAATAILGVQIRNLRVPQSVKNGSRSALLDCDYTLKPEELAADSYLGLVVKWYFNSSPSPVYQWIPGQKPQDLGILKGKLDLKHRSSDHGATMYRALYIRNPTTELSGEYKCLVSTFDDEDFMTKKMVVFVPETSLDMTQTKPNINSVKILCIARGVYPEPKMALLLGNKTKTRMDDVQVETVSQQRSYDIVATKVVQDSDLETPTVFACELRIPDTQYAVSKSVIYYPGLPLPTNLRPRIPIPG
ncbi:uncharacterized protein LOC110828738 isoform X3 [Zootermopsis nevadensis]|uniref:uncharacterized protein LOC110828738 isoform X3 n=1 Tax=Zootermopsis nevadensis TaxID=136037 RepID=UPI000B8EBB37|nr:uncharacterized protein LOC110828738 isoform X3 [Zootermopsis nevadensis]XP_021917418.1 uncharacterized protein LOC110828738 isoform X3 [Zootermopsis nevadensis]